MSHVTAGTVRLRREQELPHPYLLFLGDTVEPGFAKTAFGLREWAPHLCLGQFALPSARIDLDHVRGLFRDHDHR